MKQFLIIEERKDSFEIRTQVDTRLEAVQYICQNKMKNRSHWHVYENQGPPRTKQKKINIREYVEQLDGTE